jgi:hypothetical protein
MFVLSAAGATKNHGCSHYMRQQFARLGGTIGIIAPKTVAVFVILSGS